MNKHLYEKMIIYVKSKNANEMYRKKQGLKIKSADVSSTSSPNYVTENIGEKVLKKYKKEVIDTKPKEEIQNKKGEVK